MPAASRSHLVLIPSYNTGARLAETVDAARKRQQKDPGLRVFMLPVNRGKGAAVLHGLREAVAAGFTHVLTMDADGQHPAAKIPEFMRASQRSPDAIILGRPVFGLSAPKLRVRGRKISNWWANLETLWAGIDDSLFGLRVYPARALLDIMSGNRWMRRFDFDVEAAVRMVWSGIRPINIDAPVRYFSAEQGGVSHFDYLRDNMLLTWMHMRLFVGFVGRLPALVGRRLANTRRD
jgi:glycosyltransferase involved in cell wall biosynthesis